MDDAENIGAGTVRPIFLSFIGKDKTCHLNHLLAKIKTCRLAGVPLHNSRERRGAHKRSWSWLCRILPLLLAAVLLSIQTI